MTSEMAQHSAPCLTEAWPAVIEQMNNCVIKGKTLDTNHLKLDTK